MFSHTRKQAVVKESPHEAMDTLLNRFDSSFNASFGKFLAKLSERKQLAYRQRTQQAELFLNSNGWDLTVTSCFFFSKVESPLFCC